MCQNSRTTTASTQNLVVRLKNALGGWGRDLHRQLPYQRSC